MVTRAQVQNFITQITPVAQQVGAEYGIDPSLIVAQAAHESAFGTKAPGNNYFGVKGSGQSIVTHEQGPSGLVKVTSSFRAYPSMEASIRDYAATVVRRWPGVVGQPWQTALEVLEARPGHQYATDDAYIPKITAVVRALQANGFDANAPVPPGFIGAPGITMGSPAEPYDVGELYGQHSQPTPLATGLGDQTLDPSAYNALTPNQRNAIAALPIVDTSPFAGLPQTTPVMIPASQAASSPSATPPALSTALQWLSGGRELGQPYGATDPMSIAPSGADTGYGWSADNAAPDAGLNAALAWLSGGRDTGRPYGAQTQQQALPVDSSTPLNAVAAPPKQYVTTKAGTYEVGSVLHLKGDPNGPAFVVKADGGFEKLPYMNLSQPNTVAGGVISKLATDAMNQVVTQGPQAFDTAKNAVGGFLGNLFHSTPSAPAAPAMAPGYASSGLSEPQRNAMLALPSAPTTPAGYNQVTPDQRTAMAALPVQHPATIGDAAATARDALDGMYPNTSGSPDDRQAANDASRRASGNGGWDALVSQAQEPVLTAGYGSSGLDEDQRNAMLAAPQYTTRTTYKTEQVVNPKYQAWLSDPNSAINGVEGVPTASLDANGNVVLPDSYLGARPPAPPQYITRKVPVTTRVPIVQALAATQPQMPGAVASSPAITAALTLAQQYANMTPQQKANVNPAAAAAIQQNQTTYQLGGGGASIPTVAMNGNIRNSYGDAVMSQNMPGSPISPFH